MSFKKLLLTMVGISTLLIAGSVRATNTEAEAIFIAGSARGPGAKQVSNLQKYFQFLASTSGEFWHVRELVEKARREIEKDSQQQVSDKEVREIIALLKRKNEIYLWREWFSLKISSRYPKVLEEMIRGRRIDRRRWLLLAEVFSQSHWTDQLYLFVVLIRRADQRILLELAMNALSLNEWARYPRLVERVIERADQQTLQALAEHTLPRLAYTKYPGLVELVIEKADKRTLKYLAKFTLSQPGWENHSRLARLIIIRATEIDAIPPMTAPGGIVLGETIVIKNTDQRILRDVVELLSKPLWAGHATPLMELILEKADQETLDSIFSRPVWEKNPRFIELLRGKRATVKNIEKAFERSSGC